jgi:hypothetical protein
MVGIPFHNFNLVSVVNGHIPANYCEVRDLAVQRDAKVSIASLNFGIRAFLNE